jgi:hypothetical protein
MVIVSSGAAKAGKAKVKVRTPQRATNFSLSNTLVNSQAVSGEKYNSGGIRRATTFGDEHSGPSWRKHPR